MRVGFLSSLVVRWEERMHLVAGHFDQWQLLICLQVITKLLYLQHQGDTFTKVRHDALVLPFAP